MTHLKPDIRDLDILTLLYFFHILYFPILSLLLSNSHTQQHFSHKVTLGAGQVYLQKVEDTSS